MELNEAVELIKWLEAEQRKDKTRLNALEAALQQQAARIAEQDRLLQESERLRTAAQAELAKLPEFRKSQTRWRKDLLAKLEKDEQGRQEALRKLAQSQDEDRVNLQSALEGLRHSQDALQTRHESQEARFAHLEQGQQSATQLAAQQADRLAVVEQRGQALADGSALFSTGQEQMIQRLAEQRQQIEALGQTVRETEQKTAPLAESLKDTLVKLTQQETQLRDLQAAGAALAERLATLSQREENRTAHLALQTQQLEALRQWTEEELRPLRLAAERQDDILKETTRLTQSQDRLQSQLADAQRALTLQDKSQQDLSKQLLLLNKSVDVLPKAIDALETRLKLVGAAEEADRDEAALLQKRLAASESALSQLAESVKIVGGDLHKHAASILPLQIHYGELERKVKEQAELLDKFSAGRAPILAQLALLGEQQAIVTRKVESQTPFLERWQKQFQDQVIAIEMTSEALKKEQAKLSEELRAEQQHHRQRLNEWAGQLEEYKKDLLAWAAQLRLFEELNGQAKKVLVSVQETEKRLRQQFDEIKEVSRLTDDRRQAQLREWKGELDKKWANYIAEAQWYRGEQAKVDDGQNERLDTLEAWRKVCESELETLSIRIAQNRQERLAQLQEIWDHTAAWARRYLADVQQQVAELDKRAPTGGPR
jgi:DNA repair exonuclease SbcCD ATPase subunit